MIAGLSRVGYTMRDSLAILPRNPPRRPTVAHISRRQFFSAAAAGTVAGAAGFASLPRKRKALIAITLDLEMSAEYPKRGMTEWNYRKGDLDADTKQYAVGAAKVAKDRGGVIHFFALGQTLEQEDVKWLKDLAAAGHPVGNHTYDHVNLLATKPEDIQFRFRRALVDSRKDRRGGDRGQHRDRDRRVRRDAASLPTASGHPGGFAMG